MKKLLTTLLSLAAVTAYAGDAVDPKCPVAQPCYLAGELQVDLFGSATLVDADDDFYGGGVGINYFITQYIGVGASWNLIDLDSELASSSDTVLHDVSFDLIVRAPLGEESCTAVYGLVGGGFITNGSTLGTIDFGVGLEHRYGGAFGVFVEARQKYVPAADIDFSSFRVGARVVF
ncbi:MAG: hypothetical protein HKN23_19715 [Verrucomicrobiales bacterium]|nr:hypothetical protein [Verrucomicrobiales bacterium]